MNINKSLKLPSMFWLRKRTPNIKFNMPPSFSEITQERQYSSFQMDLYFCVRLVEITKASYNEICKYKQACLI